MAQYIKAALVKDTSSGILGAVDNLYVTLLIQCDIIKCEITQMYHSCRLLHKRIYMVCITPSTGTDLRGHADCYLLSYCRK